MAAKSEVIHCYGQLATSMSTMLELARAQEWAQLPQLEARCSAVVERLKVIEPRESLDPTQVGEALRLIDRIRADQEELTSLVKPQLDSLLARMSHLQQQHLLGKAYGRAH